MGSLVWEIAAVKILFWECCFGYTAFLASSFFAMVSVYMHHISQLGDI